MASTAPERSRVNAKALFEEGLAKTQAEVVRRLGEKVGKGSNESIDMFHRLVVQTMPHIPARL